ncbi:MAG: hypothetical protein AB7O39_00445 [Flavobacteriaceae bacterium]
MVDSYDKTHRGQMNEMYGVADRARQREGGSLVPLFIGFGLIVALLLIAAFLGASA